MTRLRAFFAPRSRKALAAGIAGALVVWAAEQAAGPTYLRSVVADLGFTGFGLGAVFGCARAIRYTPAAQRAPWLWLFAGASVWTLGQIFWDLYDLAGVLVLTNPAASDVCFLAAAPLFVAASVAFLHGTGQRLAIYALALDVGAVVLTLLAGVALFLSPLFAAEMPYEPVATVTALAFPLVYVAAFGAALSTLWGLPPERARRTHVSLVIAMALNALAFTLWLPSYVGRTVAVGTLLDPIWMIGILHVGVSSTQWVEDLGRARPVLSREAVAFSRLVVPAVVAALVATFLIGSQIDRTTATDGIVAVCIAGTVLLLATRAGLALYANYRFAEQQRRRARQYEELYEVGLAAASQQHSLDELLDVVVSHATSLTFTSGAMLALKDDDGRFRIRALRKAHASLRDAVGEELTSGIVLAATREFVVAPDYAAHPASTPNLRDVIQSAMAIPLAFAGEIIGVLSVYSDRRRTFQGETQRLFRLYAAQAAIAVANARLLEASRRLASDDPLTGVRNRRHLVERLEDEVAESRRHGDAFCVVVCDLDGLKRVNDAAGHLVGDEVLRRVAGSLSESAREEDVVARFGGDEFLLLLPRTTLLQGQALVARISARLRERTYTWAGREQPLPRVSIGVAEFPSDGLTADTLIAAADARMYGDKQRARVRDLASEA